MSIAALRFIGPEPRKLEMINVWYVLAALSAASAAVSMSYAAGPELAAADVFTNFASYGFGGIMTFVLGYALVGLYKGHKEERERWLDSMEKHFDRLITQLKENDDSRSKMAEELRSYIQTHESVSRDLRELVDRLRRSLEESTRK